MLRALLITCALAPISFCATVHQDAPLPAAVCPAIRVYTPEFEKAAGAQVEALPKDSPLVLMMADYGRERAELRACRGK